MGYCKPIEGSRAYSEIVNGKIVIKTVIPNPVGKLSKEKPVKTDHNWRYL